MLRGGVNTSEKETSVELKIREFVYDNLYFKRDMELYSEYGNRVNNGETIPIGEQQVYNDATTRLMQYNMRLEAQNTNIWGQYGESTASTTVAAVEFADDINATVNKDRPNTDQLQGSIPNQSEQQVYDEQLLRQIGEANWNDRYQNIMADIANSRTPDEREQKINYYRSELITFHVSGINIGNDIAYLRETQGVEARYQMAPDNPAFIDADLSQQDISNGYRLEYNPNGILWRVTAAGTPHPDDADKYMEQQRVIKCAANEFAEIQSSNAEIKSGIGGGDENDSEKAKQVIALKETFEQISNGDNTLRSTKEVVDHIGPGTALNAAFSNAVYYDGSQKIPDGFRSIGGKDNPRTGYYAEYFTDDRQIIVVFRGTANLKALVESDKQLLWGDVVSQFSDVMETIEQLKEIVANNPELQGLPISATGHSLGGADAQFFTLLTHYPSETFGAPGIINSVNAQLKKYGLKEINPSNVSNHPVINHVNLYDRIGTAELGGHIGVVKYYDMHPSSVIPDWSDNIYIEHSMNTYQTYLGTAPTPPNEKYLSDFRLA